MFPWIAFIAGWLVLAAPVHARARSGAPVRRHVPGLASEVDRPELAEPRALARPLRGRCPASVERQIRQI